MLIAAAEYPGLDICRELASLDSLARAASRRMTPNLDPFRSVNTLSEYLFDEVGFTGNLSDYYDPRNSMLNDVLDRRLGIPITLSLVYIEVGKRLGLPITGVGMPGHFLVKHTEEVGLYIDPFNAGILLSESDCARKFHEVTEADVQWTPSYLRPIDNLQFVARLIRNLKAIYVRRQDFARALRMSNWLITLQPAVASEQRDRGIIKYEMGNYGGALDDLQAYLDRVPETFEITIKELVYRLRQSFNH